MINDQINFVNIITQTINNLFSNLFSSIDNSLYNILDDLLFINSNIMDNSYLEAIFGSRVSGIILICNSLLIGFVLYYSLSLLFSYFTYSRDRKTQ